MAGAVTQEVYQWHNGAIIGRPDTSWLNASRRCGMDVETGLSYVGNSGPGHDRGFDARSTSNQQGPAGNCPPGHADSTRDRSHGRSLLPAPCSDPSVDRRRSGGTPGCPLPASRLANWKLRDQTVSSMPWRLRRRAAPRTPANPVPNSNRVPGSGDATRPVTSARGVAPEGS